MPGLNATTYSTIVIQHDNADGFLKCTYPTLCRREVSAETALGVLPLWSDSDSQRFLQNLERSSSSPHRNDALDLVLSCLNWSLGDYPIFLWTPRRPGALPSDWLAPRITQLTEHLRMCREPLYAAHFSYCEPSIYQASNAQLPQGHALRKAKPRDLEAVARLCKEFADDSVFFPLSIERARIEARELIMKAQVWVYDADGDIATICAVTRNSQRVSAITKVYTTPAWRRHGCAEFLVREVTGRLFDCGRDCVVLYVGHDNTAQRVYDRVGYAGLCGKDKSERIEDSLELGLSGLIEDTVTHGYL
ncbi:uncharacterized protein B0H18DRAFT_995581 [Fomitopsis serialis]|uniref:uncharacterized protein n=1 Tax=Fomitopsis serialis TaxID=139415 RepID=UPI002007C5F3|nr:uncharacterized protein B0H18DRAFT_995581 [Neoantrodia serialis]KAH9929661.1 hypothetical protein B0H18DRAFT_995581 [Neoantrodia serialis]